MLKITTAKECEFRAIYMYLGNTQIFHLGFDPGDGFILPKMFMGVCGKNFTYYLNKRKAEYA